MRLSFLPYFGDAQTVNLKCCLLSKWDSPCCHILVRLSLSSWNAACLANETHLAAKLRIIAAQWCAQCVLISFSWQYPCVHVPCGAVYIPSVWGFGGDCFAAPPQTKQLHWTATCLHHYIYRSQFKCRCGIVWNCQPVIVFFLHAHNVTL